MCSCYHQIISKYFFVRYHRREFYRGGSSTDSWGFPMVHGRGLYELLSRRLEDSTHEWFVVQKRSRRVRKCFNSIREITWKIKFCWSSFNCVVKGVADDVYQYSASFSTKLFFSFRYDKESTHLTLQHALHCSQYSANLPKSHNFSCFSGIGKRYWNDEPTGINLAPLCMSVSTSSQFIFLNGLSISFA